MKYLKVILIALPLLLAACSNKNENQQTASAQETKTLYTCTMHPQIISDHPGVCPICGMELVKITNVSKSKNENMAGMVSLTNNQEVLANISTIKVKKESLQKQLTAYSYLDFAEENQKIITARFNGRIEKLFIDKTGDYIRKGEKLFEIYSPDLVQAQNEYLIALGNSQSTNSNYLISSARKKLELFGITDSQINELSKSRQVKLTLTYYSPYSGTVIEKKVEEGMYVNEGSEIYGIADLSTIWNIADIFEKDISTVKVGNKVQLKLQAYPEQIFEGRVSFIYPVVNPQDRTIKVRTVFANPHGLLKPQMYGQTIFENDFGTGLVVPTDAILFTGKRNIVWVKMPDGMFEQRNVSVGLKFDNGYQILSGLKEGEEVAASGGFLLDSESELKQDAGNTQSEKSKSSMPGMKM